MGDGPTLWPPLAMRGYPAYEQIEATVHYVSVCRPGPFGREKNGSIPITSSVRLTGGYPSRSVLARVDP